MTQRFYYYFRTVIEFGRYAGLPHPWYEPPSKIKWAVVSGYQALLFIFFVIKVVCSLYATAQISSLEEAIFNAGMVVFTGDGLILLVFYKLRSHALKKLTDNLDNISMMINESKHKSKELFVEMYAQESSLIIKWTKILAPATVMLMPFFVFGAPISEMIEGNYGKSPALDNHCPFEMEFTYEVLLFTEASNILFPTMLKLMSEFIMLSLFKTQCTNYKYLSSAMAEVDNVADPELFLKSWAKIHQAVIRSSSELTAFVSPLVLWYFIGFVLEIAGDLLYHIDGTSGTVMQRVVVAIYDIIFVGHLYLMCSFADELSVEAESLAKAVYLTPWYKMDNSNKKTIRFIIHMANKPVQIVAYFCPGFTFNKDAFLAFMKSIISGYMAFSKILQMKMITLQNEYTKV